MDKKGTIIYIGGFELPDKNAAAHRVLSIGKILRAIGYDVVFIGVDKENPIDTNIVTTKKTVMGFDTYSQPYPRTNKQWLRRLTSTKEFNEVYSLYPDVVAVICYNYPAFACERIRHAAQKRGMNVIADCTEWYGSQGKNIVKRIDGFMRMRVIQHNVDALIVISDYLSETYKRKLHIIVPPLVDLSEDKWKPLPIVEEGYVRIVYAGAHGLEKELSECISILHRLPDIRFRFYVVGTTVAQYLKEYPAYRQIIAELNDKVVFLGKLSHSETLDQIKRSHFSVFFRKVDRVSKAGFPTKFVESISCGTPVITNSTSDLQHYLIEGKNGHFVAMDQADAQIRRILSACKDGNPLMKEVCLASRDFDFRSYIEPVRQMMEQLDDRRNNDSLHR